ncbi:MAG: hypothetical protein QF672_04045 [SAR202 cluster bacterium]|jgi:nitrous-oxide reductase|nr:hypothetical protein [SAR202 cluster bacterium]
MKVLGTPIPYVLAILLLGVIIGVGATTPLIGGSSVKSADNKYDRPYPFPHRYYADTDEYYVFASGGQQGGLYVYGLPSMKMVAEIPIFTSDQAWGWRPEDAKVGNMMTDPYSGDLVTLGDTHHPALSRTDALYDGRWVFINDKLYGRVGRVDLNTFRAGQVLWLPNLSGGVHGFGVSPDTDLAVANIEFAQWPEFVDDIAARGVETDLIEGPYVGGFSGIGIDGAGTMTNSWQVWSPWQHDMLRIGWGDSDGWIMNTTYNSERAVSTVPMFGREEDYVYFWRTKSIEDAVTAGNSITSEEAPDVPVVAWQDVEVYAAKVPLNPHGIDVSPSGKYIFIGGKATSLVVVIDIEKVGQAIAEQKFEGDEYGVPILDSEFVRTATMDLGLGPTHIDFDDKGFAYVGFFVDSDIKKVPLGGAANIQKHNMDPWKVAEVIPVHYSVGHLMVAGGDTAEPYGNYLISMNKLAKDTFIPHGPLIAENHELFDISGETTYMIDEAPFPPETHYSQAISVDLVNPAGAYDLPEEINEPGVVYDYDDKIVTVDMTVVRSWFQPDAFTVPEGWTVKIHATNIEQTLDMTHGIAVTGHPVSVSLDPGEVRDIEFTAGDPGVYWYYCIWFCSELHLEMRGRMIVVAEDEWDPSMEWRPAA